MKTCFFIIGLTIAFLLLSNKEEVAVAEKSSQSSLSPIRAQPGQEIRFGTRCEQTNVGWVKYRMVCTWTHTIISDPSGSLAELDGGKEQVNGWRRDAVFVLASILLMLGVIACFSFGSILPAFILGSISILTTIVVIFLTAAQVSILGVGISALVFSLMAVWVAMGILHTIAKKSQENFYFSAKVYTIFMVIVYSLL